MSSGGTARRLRPSRPATALALGLFLVVEPAWSAAEPATSEPLAPIRGCGPVGRRYEAVELRGYRLRRLVGTPIDRLGLVAWRDGRAQPIPVQVDERIGSRIVMTDGGAAETDDTPGVLDADDTLVFMACDAGDRAPTGTPPAAAGREIRVEDPQSGAVAWAYLVLADSPPRTTRRYVRYDPSQDIVSTAHWRIGCVDALPSFFSLAFSGIPGPNIVDGLRLRADAVLRSGVARWSITERDGRNTLEGWREGPVRVVRRSRHEVEIGLGIHLTAGILHTSFYGDHVVAPGSLKLPFSPSIFFRDITAVGGVDLQGLDGWRYLAPGVPPDGFLIDGRMDDGERSYTGQGRWFALARPGEAVFVAITMSPELEDLLPLDLLYRDDAGLSAPPELVPGSVPFVGVQARAVERLPGGRYRFQLRVLALPGWHVGAETEVLRELEAPLNALVTMPPDLPRRAPPSSR